MVQEESFTLSLYSECFVQKLHGALYSLFEERFEERPLRRDSSLVYESRIRTFPSKTTGTENGIENMYCFNPVYKQYKVLFCYPPPPTLCEWMWRQRHRHLDKFDKVLADIAAYWPPN